VLVRGSDHRIYWRSQTAPNGVFGAWGNAGLEQVKSFDAIESGGRIVIGAVFDDGTVHAKYETWGGWANLGGWNLGGGIALGKNADGRASLYAIGTDQIIYTQSETVAGANTWSGWSNVTDASIPKAREVRVVSDGAGRQYVFSLRVDGSMAYRRQGSANGAFGATLPLWGQQLQDGFSAAVNPDGRVEFMVVGGDGHVYTRYQVDTDAPDLFANWRSLGTTSQGGVVVAPHLGGELAINVVGTSGGVLRGTR
jgi:hypothetical protein